MLNLFQRLWVFFGLLLWAGLACAELDVIELRHRSADELVPLIQPMLVQGGSLSGTGYQLFLKTSPANRADIRKMIAALDKPARRLIIRIAHDLQATRMAQGGEAALVVGQGAQVEARAWGTRQLRSDNAAQMVQTVDGASAFIQVGRSLPVPMRQVVIGPGGAVLSETTQYRDLSSGFYATPQVNGQRVSIEIRQQSERTEAYSGAQAIQHQQVSTTINGRLGEWIEIGGGGRQALGQQGGYSVGTQAAREQRSLWLKVEAVE